jgi:hypothetical protein
MRPTQGYQDVTVILDACSNVGFFQQPRIGRLPFENTAADCFILTLSHIALNRVVGEYNQAIVCNADLGGDAVSRRVYLQQFARELVYYE